jgi:hypothetical protein
MKAFKASPHSLFFSHLHSEYLTRPLYVFFYDYTVVHCRCGEMGSAVEKKKEKERMNESLIWGFYGKKPELEPKKSSFSHIKYIDRYIYM